MGAAGLVAALAGRPSSRWYAIGLAAAATLALNPLAAGEPGWQLSFAAVSRCWRCTRRCATLFERGLPDGRRGGGGDHASRPRSARRRCWPSTSTRSRSRRCPPTCSPRRRSRRSCGWGCSRRPRRRSRPSLAAPLNALDGPLLAYLARPRARAAGAAPGAVVPGADRVGRACWRSRARRRSRWRRALRRWRPEPRGPAAPAPGGGARRRRARRGRPSRSPLQRREPALPRRARRARGLVPGDRAGRRDADPARRRLDPVRHRAAGGPDRAAPARGRRPAARRAGAHPRGGRPRGRGAAGDARVLAAAAARRRRRLADRRAARAARGARGGADPPRRRPRRAAARARRRDDRGAVAAAAAAGPAPDRQPERPRGGGARALRDVRPAAAGRRGVQRDRRRCGCRGSRR